MKITAEALQEVILATIPKEEHDDLYTLEEMADEDRAQVDMAATLLTERFVAPLQQLVRDVEIFHIQWDERGIHLLTNELKLEYMRARERLDERKRQLLGEEVK